MDYEDVIDILVENNDGINSEDNDGRYPLHLAAAYASEDIVKV